MLDYRCAALCHIKVIIKLVCHLVNDKRFLFQKKPKQTNNRGKTLFHILPVNLDSLLKHCLLKIKLNAASNKHFMHIIIFIFMFSYSYSIYNSVW